MSEQNQLIILSLAPVIILAFWVYTRDKYDKEPIRKLILALVAGALVPIPVLLLNYGVLMHFIPENAFQAALHKAFVQAAFAEEGFKMLAFMLLFWKSKDFNERFDGIVYAVFISLGFAAVENVLYVTGNGWQTGVMRALTAVPGHALDGVVMGYFIGRAKFDPLKRRVLLAYALIVPVLLHGAYDALLFLIPVLEDSWAYSGAGLLVTFVLFLLFLWRLGLRHMSRLSDQSKFRNL